jgi:hypothetical protein
VVLAQSSAQGQTALPVQETGVSTARPSVLLLDDEAHDRAGLLASLQIQLADLAEVRVRHDLVPGGTAERVTAAGDPARRDGATLVVWSDDPFVTAEGSQAVLYAVGERDGRALLEVVRVPGGAGPDMDRTLAIKVRELIEDIQRDARARASALALSPPPSAAGAQSARPPRVRLEAGALVATQKRSRLGQWGAELHAGPAWQSARTGFGIELGMTWYPELLTRRSGARVSLSELVPELRALGQLRVAPMWLGVHGAFGWALVDAEGRTAKGASAERHASCAVWTLGLDAELPLGDGFALALALDLQGHFVNRAFAVNALQITELAALRPALGVALRYVAE